MKRIGAGIFNTVFNCPAFGIGIGLYREDDLIAVVKRGFLMEVTLSGIDTEVSGKQKRVLPAAGYSASKAKMRMVSSPQVSRGVRVRETQPGSFMR